MQLVLMHMHNKSKSASIPKGLKGPRSKQVAQGINAESNPRCWTHARVRSGSNLGHLEIRTFKDRSEGTFSELLEEIKVNNVSSLLCHLMHYQLELGVSIQQHQSFKT